MAATAPADYTTASGTLSFSGGETSKTFTVSIFNDTLIESSESINLALTTPTGGASLGSPSAAVLTILDNDVASSPANNNFGSRISIAGSSATLSGSNANATKETGEPNHAGNTGGKSVWWTWTAPAAGTVTIDTIGSSFNTLLGVYTGTSVSALTLVKSDDDSGGAGTSKATFAVTGGTAYQIAVDGFNGAAGNITLHVNWAPAAPTGVAATDGSLTDRVRITWSTTTGATGYEVWRNTTNSSTGATKLNVSNITVTSYDDTSAAVGTAYYYFVKATSNGGTSGFSASNSGYRGNASLTNNSFAGRATITGSVAKVTGTNLGATKESGEPSHAGDAGGKSIWWKWTAPSSGTVTFDTIGSNFNTLLAVYTGSAVNALTLVKSDNDSGGSGASKLSFSATAGVTYQIAVDGYAGAYGNITLRLNAPAVPAWVNATDAQTSYVRVTWGTVAYASGYEIWRNSTNSTTGAVKLNATDVTGAQYDDTTAVVGTTYYYWVKAKNAAGTSAFSTSNSGYRASATLANNNFGGSTTLTGKNISTTGTNVGATKETGEPNHAGNAGGKSVWWKWTASSSGTVTLDTIGSSFDTLLAVYTGSSVSGLTLIKSDNDSGGSGRSKLTFTAVAGTTYQIAVDGFNGVSGNITLHLSQV